MVDPLDDNASQVSGICLQKVDLVDQGVVRLEGRVNDMSYLSDWVERLNTCLRCKLQECMEKSEVY